MNELRKIASAFRCVGEYRFGASYGSGHINDTYRLAFGDAGRDRHYILQRINRRVFSDVPALMQNIARVTRHLRECLAATGEPDAERRTLSLVPTLDGEDFLRDETGAYWRLYPFIEGTVNPNVPEGPEQAYEAARTFGEFQALLADLPGRLHETIPDFHHTRGRFEALREALFSDPVGRAAAAREEIEFALSREGMVDVVIDALAAGELPERIAHNDTKLNNVLFDAETGRGLCVIDLDTVMPGSIPYDFGDMVRTTTNSAPEDERNLSLVRVDLDLFRALVEGYLASIGNLLTPCEKDLLAFSGRLITYEIGIRFLTDFLLGDTYFKTSRPMQNLDRCRKQFALLRSMEEQAEEMRKIVEFA